MMFFYKLVGVHMGPNLCVWLISAQPGLQVLAEKRENLWRIISVLSTYTKSLPQGSEANPLLTQMEIHIQNCKFHV
jgi:hypothetical protein